MSHSKQAEVPSHRFAPREALEVARYVTVMTVQLEAMAVAARLTRPRSTCLRRRRSRSAAASRRGSRQWWSTPATAASAACK